MKANHWTDAYGRWVKWMLVGGLALLLCCLVAFVVFLAGGGKGSLASDMDASAGTPSPDRQGDTTQGQSHDTRAVQGIIPVYDDRHVILPETPDAGQEYQDQLIFVGDSLTAHLMDRGVLADGKLTKQVWRTQSAMLNLNANVVSARILLPGTMEAMTVAEAAAIVKPEIMVVTLGTDWGVSYLNETDFKACYTALVKAIQEASPRTTVILQSIFPVTADAETAKFNNEKINTCNHWVKGVAAENGCFYLDTQSVLKDESGALKAEYCNSADGIHLTAEAYEAILGYIRTHAYAP